ncbi:MAG: molecular chaperone Hsp90 [Chthoniobacteraceae bacterium]|nr:molecular chaperone Hsp90 [Chthoniobacteraceae bacterium]
MADLKNLLPSTQNLPAGSRLRLPVSAKIVVWFFLNLLLLALVALVIVRVHFKLGLDSLLTGRAGERLQSLSEVVVADLREHSHADWPAQLERFGAAYQVQLAVFSSDGKQVAGKSAVPPPRVIEKITHPPRFSEGPGPRPGLPRGRDAAPDRLRPPRDRPMREPGESPVAGDAADNRPRQADTPGRMRDQPGNGRNPRGGPRPERAPDLPLPGESRGVNYPKFIIHSNSPALYWVGVYVPLPPRELRSNGPMVLLISSTSLSIGGLLFDFTPWFLLGIGILAGSGLFWLPLVRGITRSLRELTDGAGQMAQGRFETRIDARRSDELGLLGASLNEMAGRLQEFVTGQKRFLGDIAHELCSPLARMEMALGILDQRADEKQRAYVNDVREEVREMSGLLNELLSFTKAGLRAEIHLQSVSLAGCVRAAVDREGDGNALIDIGIDETIAVLVEPQLLTRAISNVVRNAIRYAGKAGPIVFSAAVRGDSVLLVVRDHGPGVPVETLNRLFDPFFRPESARTRETGGTGLGLAIVKSCVEACGGKVAVRNANPSGLEVEMELRRAHSGARSVSSESVPVN